jgi:sec-independent protein translocase protein TatC
LAGNDDSKKSPNSREANLSFLGHLAELRRRLIYCLVGVIICAAIAWNFAEPIMSLVLAPVLERLPDDRALIYTGLPDAFAASLKISLWAGFMASAPFCLYQIWAFVAPGLLPEEKAKAPRLTAMAAVLFAAGALFAYFVAFPLTFDFFLAFSSEGLQPLLTVDRYMSLVMGLAAAFALSFQLPLVLMFLARLGLITPEFLKKQRSYAIIAIFIVAAILTPPDVVSQILLAGTLIILYELSVVLVRPKPQTKPALGADEALKVEAKPKADDQRPGA